MIGMRLLQFCWRTKPTAPEISHPQGVEKRCLQGLEMILVGKEMGKLRCNLTVVLWRLLSKIVRLLLYGFSDYLSGSQFAWRLEESCDRKEKKKRTFVVPCPTLNDSRAQK